MRKPSRRHRSFRLLLWPWAGAVVLYWTAAGLQGVAAAAADSGLAPGQAGLEQLAKPFFSPSPGFYATNVMVTIQSPVPGAVIRYTTDGSDPGSATSQVYAGPVGLSQTTIVRARAFQQGQELRGITTGTYIFLDKVVESRQMRAGIKKIGAEAGQVKRALKNLPSISLVANSGITDKQPSPASFEWLEPDGQPGFQADCGAKYFGGDFTQFAKKNFRLYFRKEFGPSRLKLSLFDGHEHGLAAVDEFDQLELRGGSHDMGERGFYMANVFADDTMLEMGHLNPHGRFVHVYLNGNYWGVFHLRERWNAAMHRRYLGGAVADYESINGNLNVGGWAPGVPYDGDGSAWTRAKRLRRDYRAVRSWIDLPQYIDFMILWMFGSCEDEYRCVGPKVAGSGFRFYLNDADGFFQSPAHPWYHEPSDRTRRGGGRLPGDGPGGFFGALHAGGGDDYRTLVADQIYAACFNDGVLTPGRNITRLERRCAELEKSFLAEAARWGYRTPAKWAAVRNDVVRHWLPERTSELIQELRAAGFYSKVDAPVLNQQGGKVPPGFQVDFAGPAGAVVIYTLDGSDPRLPGGGVAPSAQSRRGPAAGMLGRLFASGEASPPLILHHNTVVKSRVLAGSQWSALNAAFFQADEAAFDPADLAIEPRTFGSEGKSQLVEVANISARAVNLRGANLGQRYAFSRTRDTVLAPGQRLILVNDLFHFRQEHGPDAPVAGVYHGRLDSGVRLAPDSAH